MMMHAYSLSTTDGGSFDLEKCVLITDNYSHKVHKSKPYIHKHGLITRHKNLPNIQINDSEFKSHLQHKIPRITPNKSETKP